MPVFVRRLRTSLQGFTLIELLIVITILGTLVMIALINGPRFITKANDAQRKSDLEAYKIMFEHYYEDKGCYPSESMLSSCGAPDDAIRPYLPKMLCDPQTHQPYSFKVESCHAYRIYTNLANSDDPDINRVGCALNCGPDGEEIYNYGVASPGVRVGDSFVDTSGSGGPAPSSGGGSTPAPTPTTNPGGSSQGNGIYVPTDCTLQSNGTWNCTCDPSASCGIGCPGNTLCSDDGLSCFYDNIQCPIGPQH